MQSMKRSGRKQEWSLTLFIFGGVVMFPPLVTVFDKPVLVFGLPLLYVVLFGVWTILIAGIWWGARPVFQRGDGGAGGERPLEPTFDHADIAPHDKLKMR